MKIVFKWNGNTFVGSIVFQSPSPHGIRSEISTNIGSFFIYGPVKLGQCTPFKVICLK